MRAPLYGALNRSRRTRPHRGRYRYWSQRKQRAVDRDGVVAMVCGWCAAQVLDTSQSSAQAPTRWCRLDCSGGGGLILTLSVKRGTSTACSLDIFADPLVGEDASFSGCGIPSVRATRRIGSGPVRVPVSHCRRHSCMSGTHRAQPRGGPKAGFEDPPIALLHLLAVDISDKLCRSVFAAPMTVRGALTELKDRSGAAEDISKVWAFGSFCSGKAHGTG